MEAFKSISIDEMRHAERLAERIVYLGGVPTQKATQIKRGGNIKQMIQDDLNAELEAIKRYKAHIKICDEAGDPVSRLMLEEILADEEKHADKWMTLVGRS